MKGPFQAAANPAAAAAPAISDRRDNRAARAVFRLSFPFRLFAMTLPPQASWLVLVAKNYNTIATTCNNLLKLPHR